MMRRARPCLPLFAGFASLAAAACGGETIPPAASPAHQPSNGHGELVTRLAMQTV